MTAQRWTVNAIQEAMRARGSHWWDPDTMRMFGTKALPTVYQGPGGVFFVTHDNQYRRELPKRYTVRKFNPDTCDIDTHGELCEYKTAEAAKRAARKAAGGACGVDLIAETDEKHRPVSVLEQFAHDLQKHTDPSKGTTSEALGAAAQLMRFAKRHHRYMEAKCNGDWPYRDYNGEDEPQQAQQVENLIRQVAEGIGCAGVIFSGDPRGCTVKLTFADGFTNDFGREGYCVPTGNDE
jgi:hypothetical protein